MAPQLAGEVKIEAGKRSEIELFSVAGNDGQLREVNSAFAELLGLPPSELNGRSLLELVHPEDLEPVVAGLSALEAGVPEVMVESRFLQSDGHFIYLQWVARPLPNSTLWWAAGRDTTEFHRLLTEKSDLRARLDLAVGHGTAAMWELDFVREVLTWENQADGVLGVVSGSAPQTIAELVSAVRTEDMAQIPAAFSELATKGAVQTTFRLGEGPQERHVSLRGKVIDRGRRGQPLRAVGLVVDVTAEKVMEEQMLRMVMSDGLTGIPNRRAFDGALRSEWRRCKREAKALTVIMVDIDDFKKFNDTFGHLVGDEALCSVARALTSAIDRAGDTAARFGGEEFALVLPDTDFAGAQEVSDRLVAAVRRVSLRQADGWRFSVSVGAATSVPAGESAKYSELLARADEALYSAKADGKDRAVCLKWEP